MAKRKFAAKKPAARTPRTKPATKAKPRSAARRTVKAVVRAVVRAAAKVAKKARGGAPAAKAAKYVYYFGDGKAEGNRTMKDTLGGKGSGLAEMTNAGLPVPPGFTISTGACNLYYDNGGTLTSSGFSVDPNEAPAAFSSLRRLSCICCSTASGSRRPSR